MRTTRLYIPDTIDETNAPSLTLDRDTSHYLHRVMRYKSGDHVVLFNGDGKDYIAAITCIGKSVTVQVESARPNTNESPLSITLVQALAKGTKLDLVIQKATELGVSRISPVSTERSVLQLDQKRADRKATHWKKIASQACAQCHRSVVPIIDPVTKLDEWFKTHRDEPGVLIQPDSSRSFKDLTLLSSINLLVGPEGGFTDQEIEWASDAGLTTVQCGARVLRTETAGFAAIAILQSLAGDMG